MKFPKRISSAEHRSDILSQEKGGYEDTDRI
jgi:hypothetical protein